MNEQPQAPSLAEIAEVLRQNELPRLLDRANESRERAFGKKVGLCTIVNAKSGICGEDCRFCAQSVQNLRADIPIHGLLPARQLVERAKKAEKAGATSFSIVTSGRGIASDREMVELEKALAGIAEQTRLRRCASLGFLDHVYLRRLQRAGLQRYHHNLETSRSFFPSICTTHTFDQKVRTIEAAKAAGLSVCSGGIVGLGESFEQRLEWAETLRELRVDAVPINFLDARPGTPLAGQPRLSAEECLAVIAMVRLMMPSVEILVMAGQETQLGESKSSIFRAGASGTILGDGLTTRGAPPDEILAMVIAQGLAVDREAGTTRSKAQTTRNP